MVPIEQKDRTEEGKASETNAKSPTRFHEEAKKKKEISKASRH